MDRLLKRETPITGLTSGRLGLRVANSGSFLSSPSVSTAGGSGLFMSSINSSTVTMPSTSVHETYGENMARKTFGRNQGKLTMDKPTVFGDRLMPARASCAFPIGLDRHLEAHSPNRAIRARNIASENLPSNNFLGKPLSLLKDMERPVYSYNVRPMTELGNSSKRDHVPASTELSSLRPIQPRKIHSAPELALDASGMSIGPLFHTLDWSSTDLVAVAMFDYVCLRDMDKNVNYALGTNISETFGVTRVTSVSWTEDGLHLAVGTTRGDVLLFDAEASRCVRTMRAIHSGVVSMSWNENTISSGCSSGAIHHCDVRAQDFCTSVIPNAHSRQCQVSALAWSSDKKYLASGAAGDGLVKVWVPGATGQRHIPRGATPMRVWQHDCDAIKALAWCPWKSNLLAVGGISNQADDMMRIFNVTSPSNNGVMREVVTKSGISALNFSKRCNQLASSHHHGKGGSLISVYNFPSMELVATLEGQQSYVLDMVLSPRDDVLATSGLDRIIKFWHCFGDSKKGDVMRVKAGEGSRKRSCLEFNFR